MEKLLAVSVCLVVVVAGGPAKRYVDSRDVDNYAPANYQFKYDVMSPEYGTQFGHQEGRQGDVVQGTYYVLLPDGRTQVVDYVADQHGYRPRIRYEGGQGGRGGVSSYQGGAGGYERGGVSGNQGGIGGYGRGISGHQGTQGGVGGYGRGGVSRYQGTQGGVGGYERGDISSYQGNQGGAVRPYYN